MYTEAELHVLATAPGEPTVSALAEELDRSVNYVSELVDRREAEGLVHTTRSGKTKHVHRSRARAIKQRVYRELEVFHAFGDAISSTELYERVALSPDEVDEAIRSLQSKGAVAVEGDQIIEKSDTL